ncbi:hypothetical protein C8R44DRAFT_795664 [Mycena epipterygia]|nr:hypothetical protein C8R44DRAFT_795619 [Mycena epipterygia]KAJ7114449.1 hypothetical protein C8R44DRAFT_795664 [Mycena epipterygia]
MVANLTHKTGTCRGGCFWQHLPGLYTLVFVIHGILAAMHIALLVITHFHLEQRVRAPLGKSTTTLSLAISIASQTFAILYLAALLYITQRLALRRTLQSRFSTMTSIHDRQAAWSGLGSAVNTLWNQVSMPASVWNVACTTAYLTMMAGLKVTTPSLFRLVPVNQTVTFGANSTMSSPFLLNSLWNESVTLLATSFAEMISSASSMATIFMDQEDPTDSGFGLGLRQNVLYDVIAANTGPGTATINTHTMNVTCGTATDVNAIHTDPLTDGRSVWLTNDYDPSSITEIAPNVLRIAPPEVSLGSSSPGCGQTRI